MWKEKLEAFAVQGMTTQEMATELNTSRTTIGRHLKEYGIKTAYVLKNCDKGDSVTEASLSAAIEEGLTGVEIAALFGVSESSIVYWMSKYKLKTKLAHGGPKWTCSVCSITGEEHFRPIGPRTCKACRSNKISEKRRLKKKRARLYLGGKCVICGFDKYQTSLDIHHLDPSLKDPQASNISSWSWDRVKKEIRNCVLLCRNCHGAVHNEGLDITPHLVEYTRVTLGMLI